jgi:hypothetical protein
MKNHCPKCQSSDTRKVSVIYEMETKGLGGITYSGSGLGVGFGVNQSMLGQKLAPPRMPSHVGIIIGGLLFIFIILLIINGAFSWNLSAATNLFLLFILAIGLISIVVNLTNKDAVVHKKDMDIWNKNWFCSRCGSTFIVEE